MKAIPIKNHKIIFRLDRIAQDLYKLPHKFSMHPRPKNSVADLRAKMEDENFSGFPEVSNSLDYSGRAVSVWFRDRNRAFLGAIKELTENDSWYWDSMTFQPPVRGWTGWHNGGDKPHKYISFIHNAGKGYTTEIKGNVRTKIKDDHNPTTTKDWTCLVGDLDGSTTWKSDRNVGDKPRLVLTLAIPGRYHEPFGKLEEFIQSV